MRRVVVLFALMVNGAQTRSAQPNWEREIRAAEEGRRLAIATGDVSALDQLMTDDYTVVTVAGDHFFKRHELSLYRDGPRTHQQLRDADLKVRRYGHVAVVTGRSWQEEVRNAKRRELQFRFTNVWVNRNERWQLAASHATEVAEAIRSAAPRPSSDAVAAPVNIARPAQELSPAEEAVFEAYRVAQVALARADAASLSKYLTDDWYITIPTGQVRDKRSVIASLVPHIPPRIQDEIRIRMYDDVAIVTHRTVSTEGTAHRTTFVSIKQDGHWKQAANQQTIIAPVVSR